MKTNKKNLLKNNIEEEMTMKKIFCMLLVLMLATTGMVVFAADETVLLPADASFVNGIKTDAGAYGFAQGNYIGFADVNLTGINQVILKGEVKLPYSTNGETIRVRIDEPLNGQEIGFVVFSEDRDEYRGYIGGVSGVHDVYFVGTYYAEKTATIKITSFTLSKEPYKETAFDRQVSDDLVKDYYEDTWAATDSFGRKVADYKEAGPVKEGTRAVGMLYWNWFFGDGKSNATVISDITSAHPDAMTPAGAAAWGTAGMTVWDEPVYGYYNSYDYWVYRRHAELFAAAGVDVVLPDYSNGGSTRIDTLKVMAEAFRDAKRDGVNAPKISIFTADWTNEFNMHRLLCSIYYTCFQEEDYSDIWFYWDSKPLIFGVSNADDMKKAAKGDRGLTNLADEITNFFSWRRQGTKNKDCWAWIEEFPQLRRGGDNEEGRPEFAAVGVSLNDSYVGSGFCASDKYARGRAYSEIFGEDYTDEAVREGYYFKDQAALALDYDPEFLLIDGWNELKSDLYRNYGGNPLAFPDTFDSDNSRDFEPVRGLLQDDCYNMLCDLIRKYKGVRPTPTAGAEVTIDINQSGAAWDSVSLEYYNYKGEDRTGTDAYRSDRTNEIKTYDLKVANRVLTSKAARDKDNFYFMAITDKEFADGDGALQLLINADRNIATGENGYDFILGRKKGRVEAITAGANGFEYKDIGAYEYNANGSMLQIKLSRAIIGVTGSFDMEIKWVSGAFSDILDLYANLSAAPLGRFNYVFTDVAEVTLTAEERAAFAKSGVVKAGSNEMIAHGSIVTAYEPDTAVTPFEYNGTLYIPDKTFNELMGWGRSKTEYDSTGNIFYMHGYDIDKNTSEITWDKWCYTVMGSSEAYINGRAAWLSAPVVANNGIIYIPVSVFSELFGKNVTALGNGAWLIGDASAEAATGLLHYIG